ncbi:MAG: hypothetical protein HY519_04075 [Candidatus Aenigmarchaeota archaeon]|nr:hypothetical protein [Candidatus Aenigmarchaeota archaeon]
MQDVAKGAFCFAGKAFAPSSLPAYCKGECIFPSEVVKAEDKAGIARKIAAYSIACYQDKPSYCPQAGNYSNCYELIIEKPAGVTESDVTDILYQEGGCRLLENAQVQTPAGLQNYSQRCGGKDNLLWQASGMEKILIVTYDLGEKKVRVRGAG